MSQPTHWLVRKSEELLPEMAEQHHRLVVLGPYLKEQICKMIEQGVIGESDEICPENGYWIFLRDSAEVKKFLGISIQFSGAIDDDTTLPGLGADQEKTAPDFEVLESSAQGNPEATGVIKIERPKPAGAQASMQKPAAGSVASLSKTYPRQTLPQSVLMKMRPTVAPRPTIFGVEKNHLWIAVLLLSILGALFGVLWLLRSLKPTD